MSCAKEGGGRQGYNARPVIGFSSPTSRIFVFGLAGTVVGLLGLAVLVTYSVQNGIILLVIAFLVSPFGLPMLAVRVLGLLQDVNFALRDFIRC